MIERKCLLMNRNKRHHSDPPVLVEDGTIVVFTTFTVHAPKSVFTKLVVGRLGGR